MAQKTLEEYWPDFLALCELKGLARATVKDYEKQWRLRIRPAFGHLRFDELTFGAIQRWAYGLTRQTARHSVATLRVMINSAIDDGVADANPLDGRRVRYPGSRPAPRPTWLAPDVLAAMRALHGNRVEALFLALAGGGLRVEEGLALRWRDVAPDGELARLRVTSSWTEADGLHGTKTEWSSRLVPVGPPFSTRLVEIRRESEPDAPIWPLYPRMASRYWAVLFDPAMPLSALPPVKLKDLRSIHETLMQESGVLDTVNARLHGRTNVSTGYRHYLRPSAAMDGAALELSRGVLEMYKDEGDIQVGPAGFEPATQGL